MDIKLWGWYFITADHYIPNLFIAFFPFFRQGCTIVFNNFPFNLICLDILRIAFIQKVETF